MYKFDETDLKNLEKIREITITDYKVDENGCMSGKDMACIIDDLLHEIERLEEAKEDSERYYQDNWKPAYRNDYEYYGVNPKDFY